ncbi:MAG: iron-containing alcohol dehydrogenase, partial [Phycisphaeraceae bacterium]|nr:iron-containing alcohol dehydrogenase [Phycisphaeraceae bacterium]
METDTAYEMATSNIRYGPGVTREVGMDLADIGARRVMVLTDAHLAKFPAVQTVLASLAAAKIDAVLFDRVRVEPTDQSFQEAIAFAQADAFDAYVAVGGGSTMDTAKAANLYATYPADFLEYVNQPIGQGKP